MRLSRAPTEAEAVSLAKYAARASRGDSHAPYSDFNVGAALVVDTDSPRDDSWVVYDGANVEFPGRRGIHAEQFALAAAAQHSPTTADYHTLAVSCSDDGGHIPCGICLSAMTEFADDMVLLADEGDEWHETSLRAELPNAYGGHARMGGGGDE